MRRTSGIDTLGPLGPYQRLARHLDRLPGGFPATAEKIELRILERLFTPLQAELACHLTLLFESPAVVALRAGRSEPEVAPLLAEMAERGLIFSKGEAAGRPVYMAAQFAVGIWEYQVGRLTRGLVEEMDRYLPRLVDPRTWRQAPQMRVVPVARSVRDQQAIMTYEQAMVLVEDHQTFTVMPCLPTSTARLLLNPATPCFEAV